MLEALWNVRHGEPWPEALVESVNQLAEAIGLERALQGECACTDRYCDIEITTTDLYDYKHPPFVEWKLASVIYLYIMDELKDPDSQLNTCRKVGESDLTLVKQAITEWRESDGPYSTVDEDGTTCMQLASLRLNEKAVWFWLTSHPQTGGYFFEAYPKAWPDEASAKRGLREIGFWQVEELTEGDLPRLGFPK